MAQQYAANESTSLLVPVPLHRTMEHQDEGRDLRTNSTPLGSETGILRNIEDGFLSSSTSSSSSTIVQLDQEDESTPLLSSASQHSATEHQREGLEPNPRTVSDPPHVEDERAQRVFSGQLRSDTEHEHEHSPSSLSVPGEPSPVIQHSVGDHLTSNTFAQQAKIQQHRPFVLSHPTQSTIMLRRNPHAESASAGRSSTARGSLHDVNPKRVKQLISTLGFNDQLSDMLYKLVLATAPFHDTDQLATPPAPKNSNPNADALREALDTLMFAPKLASPIGSPTATAADNGSLVGNGSENPTANLLFDSNAAENLGSRPLGARSDSPPLLWSTAAAEDSLDPNAEDPTYFTVAEFINTIVENGIQVESVTDEDWLIEEMRVAILTRLKRDISEEDPTNETDSNEVVVTTDEATREVEAEETKAEQVKAKEDTFESDLQRWKKQGPGGWLKRDDGAVMNEEEIDEECARWDAMVRKARNEEEAEKAAPWLSKNIDLKGKGFWGYVRSSKQKEQTQDSISTHGQGEKSSVLTHDQDEKASQKKNKKGSRKNKNKNRKAKKNALKAVDPEDMSEEARETDTPFNFLDLPTQVKNKVLGFVLVVNQELVPYRYVRGKIVKNVGLRKKPELNILLALCSSKDKKVRNCLDGAKNILYRENIFSIRKPNHLIMFLGTIGGDNMARMKMGKNLRLTDTFFDKKRHYALEMKWLAHWGKDLLFVMKGHSIFRSDIAVKRAEDDLTCEPTEIEKALKSMVEVLKDEGQMHEMLKEYENGSGSGPMRLKSLDLGDTFDSLAEQIKTMGLTVGDGKVTESNTANDPETDAPEEAEESMSEKWKQKLREARKVIDDDEMGGYGELFLEVITNLDEEDEEDILSEESGFYTPSVYSEHGKKSTSSA